MAAINPFPIKGYESSELFCDRESEIHQLYSNAVNGIDTTLVSPRRMGKTGLIFRFFEFLNDKSVDHLYIDIYPSRSLEDFIRLLSEAVLAKFPEKTPVGKRFLRFIKGFRPLIGFDSMTGQPQIQLVYQSEGDKERTLQGILRFLEEQGRTIVVAIDEFQQITEYPEVNTEALMRSSTQHLKNVKFIYCGSKNSLMADLFSNAIRPFYNSTHFLALDKIPDESYVPFIRKLFEQNDRRLNPGIPEAILRWTRSHTYYTQSLCNTLYSMGSPVIQEEQLRAACLAQLKIGEPVYLQYRQLLTRSQWNYLIAVAREQAVTQITAQNFLSKYQIGTPANSVRISRSLIEKELLLSTTTKTETRIEVYDVFFSRWLEMEYQ
jgi:hypothetical protein